MKCQPTYSPKVNLTVRNLLKSIFIPDSENRMSFNQIKKDLLFSDVDWNMPMETRFKKTKAPFIPQEAVFNERPLRDSKADGKNNTLF